MKRFTILAVIGCILLATFWLSAAHARPLDPEPDWRLPPTDTPAPVYVPLATDTPEPYPVPANEQQPAYTAPQVDAEPTMIPPGPPPWVIVTVDPYP